jgi:hypothetical protein
LRGERCFLGLQIRNPKSALVERKEKKERTNLTVFLLVLGPSLTRPQKSRMTCFSGTWYRTRLTRISSTSSALGPSAPGTMTMSPLLGCSRLSMLIVCTDLMERVVGCEEERGELLKRRERGRTGRTMRYSACSGHFHFLVGGGIPVNGGSRQSRCQCWSQKSQEMTRRCCWG